VEEDEVTTGKGKMRDVGKMKRLNENVGMKIEKIIEKRKREKERKRMRERERERQRELVCDTRENNRELINRRS